MEEILKDILAELKNISRVISLQGLPEFQSAQVMINNKGRFNVTSSDGQEFTYEHGASLEIPYKAKEELKEKCRSFNPKERMEKFPVHYEFDTKTKQWKIFSDDKKIMKDILTHVQRTLDGKIVEKTV